MELKIQELEDGYSSDGITEKEYERKMREYENRLRQINHEIDLKLR